MKFDSGIPAIGGSFVAGTSAGLQDTAGPTLPRESMPFTVRIARSDDDIEKVVQIRYSAYARHVPTFADKLKAAEEYDFDEGSIVLLAESKLDGSPLGTMRIQTNRYRKLAIEGSVELPDWLQGRTLAEATRLGVSEGRVGTVVKVAMFKAFFLYCLDANIECIVIAARPPLDRQYDALMFEDVFPGSGLIPMRHGSNIPHRVLALELASAEARWTDARHPLLNYFCRTLHPDILVGGTRQHFGSRIRPAHSSEQIGVFA